VEIWTYVAHTVILDHAPSLAFPCGHWRQGHYILPPFFHFVSIDERPAMGSQPNLASRSEVGSICNCPKNVFGLPPNLGCKKSIKFLTTFFTTSALDVRNETLHRQTNASVNLQCVPNSWPWPLAHKRLRSVCSWWPTFWRQLRCNHHRCDMSSIVIFMLLIYFYAASFTVVFFSM